MQQSARIADLIREAAEAKGVEPYELAWNDLQAHVKETGEGLDIASEVSRVGGYNRVRDAYFAPKTCEVSVDRKRVFEHALTNRRLAKDAVDTDFFLSRVEKFAAKVFRGRIRPAKLPPPGRLRRTLTAVLSDPHFGADISAEETGHLNYGRVEEARRLAQVVRQVLEYKPEHRGDTALRLLLLGDIVQGALHDPRDGAELAEQSCRAIHLLGQALAQLASRFGRVEVLCTPGNHDRFVNRHPKRATHQKYDSMATVIYYALSKALAQFKNVTFRIPKTPFIAWQDFGQHLFATHGDTVLNTGFPGRSIPVEALERAVNRMNASLRDAEYSVMIVGHVHTPSITLLANGTWLVTNGTLAPVDSYGTSLGLLEAQNCGQWLFESVEGFPVGDCRLIRLDAAVDADKSLDRLVTPWVGFDGR